MKSISTSDTLVKVENLNLVYKLALQRNQTWRDVFTAFSKNPIETLAPQKERLQILKDISFKVKKGERVGLIGVNGAGKSSLCRCVSGMFKPTAGKVTLNAPVRAIFHTGIGIQPELTGRENAELLAHFLFPGDPDMKDLVDEALIFSELGRFVDIPYKNYSSGMQARLYLSLISAKETGILILDEVFDGADVFFREKISIRVMNMIKNSGAAIFVSHSFDQVYQVCNRVLVLHQSQIIYDGPPQDGVARFKETGPSLAAN